MNFDNNLPIFDINNTLSVFDISFNNDNDLQKN